MPGIGQGSQLGGFFSLNDFYDRQPGGALYPAQPGEPSAPGAMGPGGGGGPARAPLGGNVPHQFMAGSNLPSTNNWMLLPPPYNKPGYAMRNGHIIDNSPANQGRGGFWAPGIEKIVTSRDDAGQLFERRPGSGAQFGFPALMPSGGGLAYAFWPGQLEPATMLQENRA